MQLNNVAKDPIFVEILDFLIVVPIDMIAFDTTWMEFLLALHKDVGNFQKVINIKSKHKA